MLKCSGRSITTLLFLSMLANIVMLFMLSPGNGEHEALVTKPASRSSTTRLVEQSDVNKKARTGEFKGGTSTHRELAQNQEFYSWCHRTLSSRGDIPQVSCSLRHHALLLWAFSLDFSFLSFTVANLLDIMRWLCHPTQNNNYLRAIAVLGQSRTYR